MFPSITKIREGAVFDSDPDDTDSEISLERAWLNSRKDYYPDFMIELEYGKSVDHSENTAVGDVVGVPDIGVNIGSEAAFIMEQRTSTTYLSGRLTHVEYGKFFDLPACLVVMKFTFQAFRPSSGKRFKSGVIQVNFGMPNPAGEAGASNVDDGSVRVLAFVPELIYGEVSTENRQWHWDITIPVGYTDGMFTAGIEPGMGRSSEYTQGHRAVVQGSATGRAPDGVLWSLEESKISEKGIRGIPTIVTVACIVQHNNNPFQGTFKVAGNVGFTLDPKHWLPFTGKPPPIRFIPDQEQIHPGRPKLADRVTRSFDGIELSHLTTFSSPPEIEESTQLRGR